MSRRRQSRIEYLRRKAAKGDSDAHRLDGSIPQTLLASGRDPISRQFQPLPQHFESIFPVIDVRLIAMIIGDLAALVSAFGAVGALIAAIVAARQANKLFQLESERDRIAEADRKQLQAAKDQEQASSISAWVLLKKVPNDPERAFLVVATRNASELPIYALKLRVLGPDGKEVIAEQVAVLPPGDSPVELPQIALCEYRSASDSEAMRGLAVQMTFLDASGKCWRRDADGTLHNLPSTPSPRFLPPPEAQGPALPNAKTKQILP
jgi:hypothetical protein